jgi:hypothetical protein
MFKRARTSAISNSYFICANSLTWTGLGGGHPDHIGVTVPCKELRCRRLSLMQRILPSTIDSRDSPHRPGYQAQGRHRNLLPSEKRIARNLAKSMPLGGRNHAAVFFMKILVGYLMCHRGRSSGGRRLISSRYGCRAPTREAITE